jgi:hypothetical protein
VAAVAENSLFRKLRVGKRRPYASPLQRRHYGVKQMNQKWRTVKMDYLRKAFILVSLILFAHMSAAQTTTSSVQSLSAWTNQSGSTLYIDAISPSGQLTGHYINRAAGYGCQNISYPVTGWVYGTAITFTTKWQSSTESCNSITAWTGFLFAGKLQTLWQLVINGSTSTQQIKQGADVFTQTATTTRETLINPQ